jgi:hypothetical protein
MSEVQCYDKKAVVNIYRMAERLDDLNMPWLAMDLRGNLHTLLASLCLPKDYDDKTGRSIPKTE